MTRRKNKADMTITEQFEKIKEDMCVDYCKFHQKAFEEHEDPDDALEYLMDNICSSCPMSEV